MARCRSIFRVKATTKSPAVELACDLDSGHETVLSFHYDKAVGIEWRFPLKPVPVPSTRTTSPKRAAQYASIATQQFDVIKL
jgi:hypothetical protein